MKKKWRECKSACHDVMSELSKKGQQCNDCKGPAFRANYKDNPKHGTTDQGIISRRPTNGEQAMYNSVSWKGDVRRCYGTSNGEIVEIKMTGNNPQNEYHGYVRYWTKLTDEVRNFLIGCGLKDKNGRLF